MIRVIHVRDSPFVGGPEKQILGQCERLDRSRFEPVIASFSDSGTNALLDAARAAGIRAEPLPDSKLALPHSVGKLRSLFAARCVVIGSGFKADFTARLACPHERVPWLAWFHGYTAVSPRVRLYEALDLAAIRQADGVIAVSESSARDLRAMRLSNVVTIPNAIDVALVEAAGTRDSARRTLGFDQSAVVVGTVCRLSVEKGVGHLLDAAGVIGQAHPEVRFLIIGDGPIRHQLQQQAERLGLARSIIFGGHREDAVALIRAMDVFVLPSLRENLPVALLEAMACGVSIVATDVGGVGEALSGTGVVPVPPGNHASIADAVIRLIDNAGLRAQLSAKLVERAKAYSFEQQVASVEGLVEELFRGTHMTAPAGRSRGRLPIR